MLGDGVGRFHVLVETHQRIVPGEAAVVEIQNRTADRTQSQRFVHHHPERLLLERREILHALVEIGRSQEGLAQFVGRDVLAFVGGFVERFVVGAGTCGLASG